jgi:hypothetical protein
MAWFNFSVFLNFCELFYVICTGGTLWYLHKCL